MGQRLPRKRNASCGVGPWSASTSPDSARVRPSANASSPCASTRLPVSPLYSMITEAVSYSSTGRPAGLRSSLPPSATISISAATILPAVSMTFAFPEVLPISDRASGNCGKNGDSAASLKSSTLTSSRISIEPASPIAATLIRPPGPFPESRRPSKLATKVPSAAIITSSSTSPKLSGARAGSPLRNVKLEESTRS